MRKFLSLISILQILVFGCGEKEEFDSPRLAQDNEVWIDLGLRGFVGKELEKKIADTPKSTEVLDVAGKKSEKRIEPGRIETEWNKYSGHLVIRYGEKDSNTDRLIANFIAECSLSELKNLAENVESNPVILRRAKTPK